MNGFISAAHSSEVVPRLAEEAFQQRIAVAVLDVLLAHGLPPGFCIYEEWNMSHGGDAICAIATPPNYSRNAKNENGRQKEFLPPV